MYNILGISSSDIVYVSMTEKTLRHLWIAVIVGVFACKESKQSIHHPIPVILFDFEVDGNIAIQQLAQYCYFNLDMAYFLFIDIHHVLK